MVAVVALFVPFEVLAKIDVSSDDIGMRLTGAETDRLFASVAASA